MFWSGRRAKRWTKKKFKKEVGQKIRKKYNTCAVSSVCGWKSTFFPNSPTRRPALFSGHGTPQPLLHWHESFGRVCDSVIVVGGRPTTARKQRIGLGDRICTEKSQRSIRITTGFERDAGDRGHAVDRGHRGCVAGGLRPLRDQLRVKAVYLLPFF